jgi:hypothetical protein
MATPLRLVLLVLAFVCFLVATAYPPDAPRVRLVAAGLAAWVASLIF